MTFFEFADLPLDKLAELDDSPLAEALRAADTQQERMRFQSMHF